MIGKFYNFFNNDDKYQKLGQYSFLIGIILLPSAISISLIFLIFASLISYINKEKIKFDNKLILILKITSFLMILRNIKLLIDIPTEIVNFNNLNSWVDLFNWIPLFYFFWSFQLYIRTEKQRDLFIKSALIGTVPVIFSCISQSWFGIYGPFSTLNGLIIWFQKPPQHPGIVSGLFNNPNYAAFWLASMWPFSLTLNIKNKKNIFKIIFSFLILYFTILTNSRNALFSILASLPIFLGFKSIIYISLIISLFLLTNIFSEFLLENVKSINNFIPLKLINKLIRLEFIDFRNIIRLDIYFKAIKLILRKPIFGWGASTFPFLFITLGSNFRPQHTHNISLEIAFNYGLPVSIILTSLISYIAYKSFRIIFFDKYFSTISNKAWYSTFIVSLIFNFTDITYYDGKFSTYTWIILSGLFAIIQESKYSKEFNKLKI